MYYIYLLKSKLNPSETYVGFTSNLKERISKHNAGGSKHTSKNKPWELVTYIAFSNKKKALSFEKHLKGGSGHSFAKKRFW